MEHIRSLVLQVLRFPQQTLVLADNQCRRELDLMWMGHGQILPKGTRYHTHMFQVLTDLNKLMLNFVRHNQVWKYGKVGHNKILCQNHHILLKFRY